MTDILWMKRKLSEECNRARTDKTYTDIVEDNRMDSFIIDAVLERMARLYGFSSFEHMNSFMAPDTKATDVVYVGNDRRSSQSKEPRR